MYKKGDIVLIRLNKKGSTNLSKGKRLCLVISNDKHNDNSETLTVVPLSSKTYKRNNTFNIFFEFCDEGLSNILYRDSIAMINQISTYDTKQVNKKISHLDVNSRTFKRIIRKIVNYISD